LAGDQARDDAVIARLGAAGIDKTGVSGVTMSNSTDNATGFCLNKASSTRTARNVKKREAEGKYFSKRT